MASVWVTPRDNGWAVIVSGNERASKVFKTQAEAEAYGRQLAKDRKCEFVLKGRDNKIREKDSYGNDPYPPKG